MDTLNHILSSYFNTYYDNLDFIRSPLEIQNLNRNDLAQIFSDLHFKSGAEIGVEQGVYSEVLLKANPNLYLHCVDAWQAHQGYKDHTNQEKLDKFYHITCDRLKKFDTRYEIWKAFSLDVVKRFVPESLDFVYIDANHDFLHVTQDIFYWSKMVRKGGIVAGHDYYRDNRYSHVHVKQVLDGYTEAYNIKPLFIIDDSWFFVKI